MLNDFDLLPAPLSPLRALAMRPKASLPGPFRVAAVLVTYPEEAPRTVAGELHHTAIAPTAGTGAFLGYLATLLGRPRLLLCHERRGKKWSGVSRRTAFPYRGEDCTCQGEDTNEVTILRAPPLRASVPTPPNACSPAPATPHGRGRGPTPGRAAARGTRHPSWNR